MEPLSPVASRADGQADGDWVGGGEWDTLVLVVSEADGVEPSEDDCVIEGPADDVAAGVTVALAVVEGSEYVQLSV